MNTGILTVENVFIRTRIVSKPKADLWFIHGFGESSLCYAEAFETEGLKDYNLYALDNPGFGASPIQPNAMDVPSGTALIKKVISKVSEGRKLVLVGHSLGGLIITEIAEKLPSQVLGCVSIEGNVTQADTFMTSLTLKHKNAQSFYQFYVPYIFDRVIKENDDVMHRYYASLRFVDTEALYRWGKSCYDETGTTEGGKNFSRLKCKKVYYWGDRSTPATTKDFILKNDIPHFCFEGSGHWPMVDNPRLFYKKLLEFLKSL